MKRFICAALAAGLLAGPLAARARAEEAGKKNEDAERMENKMKERLGLSDDQAAKLKAAWEAEKAAVKPLREQAKEGERKLEEQVRGLASDKDIQATLDQLDAGRKAMMAERQKVESTLASVLKPSQRAKMRLFMAHMKNRGPWGHADRDRREGRKCEGGEDRDDSHERHHDDD